MRYYYTATVNSLMFFLQDTNIYFCIALSAYAEECLRNGKVLDWRSNAICREFKSTYVILILLPSAFADVSKGVKLSVD